MSKVSKKHGLSDRIINDGHWHISRHFPVEESLHYIKKAKEYLGIDKVALLSYEYADDQGFDYTSNLKALYLRDNCQGDAYAFAALTHFADERDNPDEFLRQVMLYHELGFDGIKILEGRNDFHEMFGCKFDSENYEPMFDYLEKTGFPLIMHVAGFIPFPDEALEKEREALQGEMLNVLAAHPNLRITFAHMFNMAHDRKKLEQIMEKYPNVSVDLALGGDFVIRFSNDLKGWREFFTKFSQRVIFGTDTYNSYFEEEDDREVSTRYLPIRKFFEEKEPFRTRYYDSNPKLYGEHVVLKPALLEEHVVSDIYVNSFIRAYGITPRITNPELIQSYCDDILEGYQTGRLKSYLIDELPGWLPPEVKENAALGNKLALENIMTIKDYYRKSLCQIV